MTNDFFRPTQFEDGTLSVQYISTVLDTPQTNPLTASGPILYLTNAGPGNDQQTYIAFSNNPSFVVTQNNGMLLVGPVSTAILRPEKSKYVHVLTAYEVDIHIIGGFQS